MDLMWGHLLCTLSPCWVCNSLGGPSSEGSHLPSLQTVPLKAGQMVVSSKFETRLVLGSNSDCNIH